jgi:hypothetical protein
MTSCIIDVHSQQWIEVLGKIPHDVYHLPEYFELSAKLEGGHPVAFLGIKNSSVLFVPFLVKELPSKFSQHILGKDASSPYGYASPLILNCSQNCLCKPLLNEMFKIFQSLGLISVFFRLHPLLEFPLDEFSQFGNLVHHGQTVSIDLDKQIEEIFQNFCKNHKRGIKKLQKDGYAVVIDEWSYYEKFIHLYLETMERVGASKFYFFDSDYFEQLKNSLRQHLHLFVVLSSDNKVASGGLFTGVDGIAQYHLGASSSKFLNVAPSKLMFYEAILWAKRIGFKKLHLGGGLGACNDSLFQFKKGFSDSVNEFYTWRIIVDTEKYKLLEDLNLRGKQQIFRETEFFPKYRIT